MPSLGESSATRRKPRESGIRPILHTNGAYSARGGDKIVQAGRSTLQGSYNRATCSSFVTS